MPTAVLHAGRYSYRKPSVLIIGAGISLISGGLGLYFLLNNGLPRSRDPSDWLTLLFTGGILGLLFTCGVFLLISYARNHALELQITRDGVRYGKHHYPWAEIRWIGGTSSGGSCQLAIGRRLRPDQSLMTDHGLDEPAFDRLMETLREEVLPAHPTLKFPGIRLRE